MSSIFHNDNTYLESNKKFWEELIAYFPLIRHGPPRSYMNKNYQQLDRGVESGFLKAPRAVRQLNMVMSPVGLGTKSHCAGEDQKKSSSQSRWGLKLRTTVLARACSNLVNLDLKMTTGS
jgi:hypothetical protein